MLVFCSAGVAENEQLVPVQLNVAGFAQCLTETKEPPSRAELRVLRRRHHLASDDHLLVFLALYPGRRFPGLGAAQDDGRRRWSERFRDKEERFAEALWDLSARGSILPNVLLSAALETCGEQDLYCAFLLQHNVLRTLGRRDKGTYFDPTTGLSTDYNPAWFTEQRSLWLDRIPIIQRALIPLRADGLGDRWGEWYHLSGIFTFATHEAALFHSSRPLELIVQWNRLLNPWLAGSEEEPEKARLDRDAVQIWTRYFGGEAPRGIVDCSSPAAFVAINGRVPTGTW